MAGANSIFYGDKLLTTGNPDVDADGALLLQTPDGLRRVLSGDVSLRAG